MALTDTAIKAAKAKDKPYKLGDSGGLFLLVQPTGGKLWRLKYRVDRKEKKLGLGTYPEVSLADARKRRDAAKAELAAGKDPGVEKVRRKVQSRMAAGNSFSTVAAEFINKRTKEGWAASTQGKADFFLSYLNPVIGKMPVSEIAPADLLPIFKRAEAKGNLETARRLLQFSSQVFRYAVATTRLASDPTRDLRGALIAPKPKHHGAIIESVKVGELLRAIDGYTGHYITLYALKLAPHLFVRPGELRFAEWAEIDLDAAVWAIPSSRMKMRRPHHVPLSRQAVELFRGLRELAGDRPGYVFPSIRSTARAMSENTLNAALRRMGYTGDEMTAHGFRAMASTLLNESGKWHPDEIERALAHQDSDNVRAAYHRGAHWKERVEMAQWWSDHLDLLRKGGDIVPFPGSGQVA
ncbi:tyrosine-type recombinase/integrase [Rhizorhapis sp.]|uniref:tyrosine-type recombinase/integrase n=1 Tax=Rhizorhapis sp. TaxID=1968842 RepID=UPI002B4802A5|nr:integrase arm-type DNA-binding domain-containing protein [Rhizorhapis sp.]HKR16614.1 integrase arm-type DNA-binding domain-containing protein [Rhizorhapis sp.]